MFLNGAAFGACLGFLIGTAVALKVKSDKGKKSKKAGKAFAQETRRAIDDYRKFGS